MKRRLMLGLICLLVVGCDRDDTQRLYKPGGRYFQMLDASGRRHLVLDTDGGPLAKLRIRDDSIKVYDAEMRTVGTIEWPDDALHIMPWGTDEPLVMTSPDEAVREVDDRFRLEQVENGWALFDPESRRLGYLARTDDGRFALRDDYSAAPRVYARAGESEARSPAGKTIVSTRPALKNAPLILPFALEGDLGVLDRVAVGVWLVYLAEVDPPAPTSGESPDAGRDADGPAE